VILVQVWVDEGENNSLPLCRATHHAPARGGSRNIEGVYITCRSVGNNFVVVRRLPKAVVRDPLRHLLEYLHNSFFL